jgi:DNA-binding IclR family transcriptional regulator
MATNASSTVLKAFQVLDLFRDHPVVGAAECARLLGMPRASAYRMLISLVEAGVLEVTPSGHYRLTLKVFELGLHVPRQRWLYDAAYLAMERLVSRTRLSAHLAVREELQLVYVVNLRHAPDRTSARPGERNWLHATAIGKVLLAYASPDLIEDLFDAGLRPFTPNTITTRKRLREQLEVIRHEGCAYDREERTLGLVSVAVPIRDRGGETVAALSVLGPVETYRGRMDRMRDELFASRAEIERRLTVMTYPRAKQP